MILNMLMLILYVRNFDWNIYRIMIYIINILNDGEPINSNLSQIYFEKNIILLIFLIE
jgi:hypothetical protein